MNNWLDAHPMVGILAAIFLAGYWLWDAVRSSRRARTIRERIEERKREEEGKSKNG